MSYIIPIAILLGLIQKVLDNKIRKELVYGDSISDTDGKKYYIWTIVILIIPSAFCIFYFSNTIHPAVGLLFTLLFLVRSLFEWKYIKETKRHVVSSIMTLLSLMLTIIFYGIWL